MRTVWKYVLKPRDNTFQMPVGAKVLSVGKAQGELALWALIEDTEADRVDRHFFVVGTGHQVPNLGARNEFVGTAVMPDAMPGMDIVLHVFEYFKQ